MKRLILFLFTLTLAYSCSYKQELDDLNDEVRRLQALVTLINERTQSLQDLIAASQAENDWVTSIEKKYEGDRETGTMIYFLHRDPIFISNGIDGEKGDRGSDGADGKDADAPDIGIRMDDDGAWYWTMNGDWLLNDRGEKVMARGTDGTAPKIKLESGKWWVSYDGGNTWFEAGDVIGSNWSTKRNYAYVSIIDNSACLITLNDGQRLYLPLWVDFEVSLPYGTTYYLKEDSSISVAATISPYTETTIRTVCDNGLSVGEFERYIDSNVMFFTIRSSEKFTGGNIGLVFSKGEKLVYKQLSVHPIDNSDKSVTGMTISPSSLYLALGCSYTLSASVIPVNDNYHNIIWSSDNPSVASVSSNGLVTAVSPGECSIYATAHNGVYDKCKVRVGSHKGVDLGLSVNWADCNLGATSIYENGDYYAWGETSTKSGEGAAYYSWDNYRFCKGSAKSLLRYNTKSSYGNVDNVTVLDASDDAASVQWGGNWRMPTAAEWAELYDHCTWEWLQSGASSKHIPDFTARANGYLIIKGGTGITAMDTSSYIFIPAGGFFSGFYTEDTEACHYWSGTLNADYPDCSLALAAGASYIKPQYGSIRCYGMNIRPVTP